jgi:hypothetical protein
MGQRGLRLTAVHGSAGPPAHRRPWVRGASGSPPSTGQRVAVGHRCPWVSSAPSAHRRPLGQSRAIGGNRGLAEDEGVTGLAEPSEHLVAVLGAAGLELQRDLDLVDAQPRVGAHVLHLQHAGIGLRNLRE